VSLSTRVESDLEQNWHILWSQGGLKRYQFLSSDLVNYRQLEKISVMIIWRCSFCTLIKDNTITYICLRRSIFFSFSCCTWCILSSSCKNSIPQLRHFIIGWWCTLFACCLSLDAYQTSHDIPYNGFFHGVRNPSVFE